MKIYSILVTIPLIALSMNAFSKDAVRATVDKSDRYQRYASLTNSKKNATASGALRELRWHAHDTFERLVFDFQEDGEITDPERKTDLIDEVPRYTAVHHGVPDRLVIRYNSRIGPKLKLSGLGKKSSLVRRSYPLPLMDDAAAAFVIEFKEQVEVEVFELENPGRLVVDVRKVAEPEVGVVFAARTKTFSLEAIEEIASLAEQLRKADGVARPHQLLTADGKGWCLQLGHSLRDWKAQILCAGFGDELEKQLSVEERKNLTDAPAAEFEPVRGDSEE